MVNQVHRAIYPRAAFLTIAAISLLHLGHSVQRDNPRRCSRCLKQELRSTISSATSATSVSSVSIVELDTGSSSANHSSTN